MGESQAGEQWFSLPAAQAGGKTRGRSPLRGSDPRLGAVPETRVCQNPLQVSL